MHETKNRKVLWNVYIRIINNASFLSCFHISQEFFVFLVSPSSPFVLQGSSVLGSSPDQIYDLRYTTGEYRLNANQQFHSRLFMFDYQGLFFLIWQVNCFRTWRCKKWIFSWEDARFSGYKKKIRVNENFLILFLNLWYQYSVWNSFLGVPYFIEMCSVGRFCIFADSSFFEEYLKGSPN